MAVFTFWSSHRAELATLFAQHVLLVAFSTLVAVAAGFVLILYGLLPIIRTTIAGLNGIDPAVREAGVAMGMTPRELLRLVELPLALTAIVAAAIGAGGLGEYIYRGLSMVDTTVILAGAIPAAILALAVDGALWWT